MAKLITPPGAHPIEPGEAKVIDFLRNTLPDTYSLLPNLEIAEKGKTPCEYDLVVVAPHAVYVVEIKHWRGGIRGDDNTWWGAACPAATPDGWRQQIINPPDSTNLMLAHAVNAPETDLSIFSVSEDALQAAKVDLALLGSSHQAHIPRNSGRVVFPGSPQPLEWSDKTVGRGAVLVTIGDHQFSAEQIRLRSWRFVDLAVSIEECRTAEDAAEILERELASQDAQDALIVIAQATLNGEPAGDFTLAEVRAALAAEVNLVLHRPFSFPYDLDQLAQEQTDRKSVAQLSAYANVAVERRDEIVSQTGEWKRYQVMIAQSTTLVADLRAQHTGSPAARSAHARPGPALRRASLRWPAPCRSRQCR